MNISDIMFKHRLSRRNGHALLGHGAMAREIKEFGVEIGQASLWRWELGKVKPDAASIEKFKKLAANEAAGWVRAWAADMLAAMQTEGSEG